MLSNLIGQCHSACRGPSGGRILYFFMGTFIDGEDVEPRPVWRTFSVWGLGSDGADGHPPLVVSHSSLRAGRLGSGRSTARGQSKVHV